MKTHSAEGPRRRVVIYCRISSDPEGLRAGVDRQERDCRQRADRLGWDVVEVLVENDLSAFSGKRRPEYEHMLEMLRTGEADAVLALSPKRLYRQLKDGLGFLDLIAERGIEVVTLKQGRYDLSTAEGRRDARRAAVDAQYESEEIGERVRDAKVDAAAQGKFRGGPRPFGYEADGITPRTLECPDCSDAAGFDDDRVCLACGADALNALGSEAWHVEQATLSVVAGGSLYSIERQWAQAGVRTVARRYRQPDGTKGEPEDRAWAREEIRKMLLRPRNAGLMEVSTIGPDGKRKSEITGRAGWPALVDEETWRACKSVLENPARRTTTSSARKWPGSGVYECHCGSTVRCSSTGVGGVKRFKDQGKSHRPAYKCKTNASHITRDAGMMDAFIRDVVVARLSQPDASELHIKAADNKGPDASELNKQAANLRAKLDSLASDYAQDLITRQQMLDTTALTRARLQKIESEMSRRASANILSTLPLGNPEAMEREWELMDIVRQGQVISAVVQVVINRARRGTPTGFQYGVGGSYFDTDSIELNWKPPA